MAHSPKVNAFVDTSDDDLFDVVTDGFFEPCPPDPDPIVCATGNAQAASDAGESSATRVLPILDESTIRQTFTVNQAPTIQTFQHSGPRGGDASTSAVLPGEAAEKVPAQVYTPATTTGPTESSPSPPIEPFEDAAAPLASSTEEKERANSTTGLQPERDRSAKGKASRRGCRKVSSRSRSPRRSRSPLKRGLDNELEAYTFRQHLRPPPSEPPCLKHVLHCFSISDPREERLTIEHCELYGQLNFNVLHSSPGFRDSSLKLYVANWCTEWMHDSLVRETGIPEPFFAGWRKTRFRAHVESSPLHSRQTSIFFDYPHMHTQNQEYDTFPRPPNVLRFSPSRLVNFGTGNGSAKGTTGIERWGIQRLCAWIKNDSKKGGPPNYTMVIFLDKPPQWYDVQQSENVVDLYRCLLEMLEVDSVRRRAASNPLWLVSALLRESVPWHDFSSCTRRQWNNMLNASLSMTHEQALLRCHRLREEFFDLVHFINDYDGLAIQLKHMFKSRPTLSSRWQLGAEPSPSVEDNLKFFLEQLKTAQESIKTLQQQVDNHVAMLRDSFALRTQHEDHTLVVPRETERPDPENLPVKDAKAFKSRKDKKSSKHKRRKLRRRAKLAFALILVMMCTNNMSFHIFGVLFFLSGISLAILAAFLPDKLRQSLRFVLHKLDEANDDFLDDMVGRGEKRSKRRLPDDTVSRGRARAASRPTPQAPLPKPVMRRRSRSPEDIFSTPLCGRGRATMSPLPPPPPPPFPLLGEPVAGLPINPLEPPLVNGAYSLKGNEVVHTDVPFGFATIMYMDRPPGAALNYLDRHLPKFARTADGRLRPFNGDTIMIRESSRSVGSLSAAPGSFFWRQNCRLNGSDGQD